MFLSFLPVMILTTSFDFFHSSISTLPCFKAIWRNVGSSLCIFFILFMYSLFPSLRCVVSALNLFIFERSSRLKTMFPWKIIEMNRWCSEIHNQPDPDPDPNTTWISPLTQSVCNWPTSWQLIFFFFFNWWLGYPWGNWPNRTNKHTLGKFGVVSCHCYLWCNRLLSSQH